MLVDDDLLQRAPWTLPGLSAWCRKRLRQIVERGDVWAPCCAGLPAPTTVAELLKWRPSMLLSFPNFGRESLLNLETVLQAHGLKLSFERQHDQNHDD